MSHYNYYRNFDTLFRALPILSERLHRKKMKLFLTCQLSPRKKPGSYRAESASSLMNSLGVSENVVELGTVPYRSLHHLYRASDIYVSPAYAESFAHPLLESMSSGLPLVASDLPVHREICGDAATYFPRFSRMHWRNGSCKFIIARVGRNALTKRPQPGARLPMGHPRGASAHLGPGTRERKSETRLSLGEKGDERVQCG